MNSVLSKTYLKDLLTKCTKSIDGGSFVDGLVLGVLLKSDVGTTDTLIDLFSEWKDSAKDMEVVEDDKKIFMYISYLTTFTKGRLLPSTESVLSDGSLKKRDEKLIRKWEEENQGLQFSTEDLKTNKETSEEINGHKSPETISICNLQEDVQPKQTDEKDSEFDINSEDKFSSESDKNAKIFKEIEVKDSEDKKEDVPKCSLWNQGSNDLELMRYCEHPYHPKCLKDKVYETIVSGNYKIRCLKKNWAQTVDRDVIVPLISEDAKICYDTLQFINDFNMMGGEKTLYWCHKCRYISVRYPTQSSSCTKCKKKMDKLKSVLSLSKLLLTNDKLQVKDKMNYEMIGYCITDWESQIKKCEVCKFWKHKFTSVSMKCVCLQQ